MKRLSLAIAMVAVFAMVSGASAQVLWDQSDINAFGPGFFNSESGGPPMGSTMHTVTDVTAPGAWNMTKITTYYSAVDPNFAAGIFQGYVHVFASFMERYRGIELTVCASYDPVSLRRHEAEVALRLLHRPPEELVGTRLGAVEFGVYVHRDLISSNEDIDLNSVPWLRTDARNPDASTDAWLARNAPNSRTSMRFDSYPLLRTAVRSGIGAHMLACMDGDDDPSLVRIVPDHHVTLDLWALTLPETRTNSRARAFLDHVASKLAA